MSDSMYNFWARERERKSPKKISGRKKWAITTTTTQHHQRNTKKWKQNFAAIIFYRCFSFIGLDIGFELKSVGFFLPLSCSLSLSPPPSLSVSPSLSLSFYLRPLGIARYLLSSSSSAYCIVLTWGRCCCLVRRMVFSLIVTILVTAGAIMYFNMNDSCVLMTLMYSTFRYEIIIARYQVPTSSFRILFHMQMPFAHQSKWFQCIWFLILTYMQVCTVWCRN